jgi:FdhD protein
MVVLTLHKTFVRIGNEKSAGFQNAALPHCTRSNSVDPQGKSTVMTNKLNDCSPGQDKQPHTESFAGFHYSEAGKEKRDMPTAIEMPVTIMLNGEDLVTLLASPDHLDLLAAGYLLSEGFVKSRADVLKIVVDSAHGIARVETRETLEQDPSRIYKRIITSGCGRGTSFYSSADSSSKIVQSTANLTPEMIYEMARQFQHMSKLYLNTHGVHSAGLYDRDRLLVFHEDIGRHNAVDKIVGQCLMDGIEMTGKVVISSGRVTSDILYKISKRDIPILITVSSPTNMAVRLAESLNITLVASVRGAKMNVYTHDFRIS